MLRFTLFLSALALYGASYAAEPAPTDPVAVEDIEPTVVGFDDYRDPLEPLNRKIFIFNDVLYRHALIPLGNGYVRITPTPVRNSISFFFNNLREPLNAINHGLQGEFSATGKNMGRFLLNSTIGLLGLFDPSADWFGIPPENTSLSETFMHHHVGQGAFIVIPVLGASDVRNGFSRAVESLANPIRYLTEEPETTYLIISDNFQSFAASADAYLELKAASDDPYLYFRNQYLQGVARDQEVINDGR